MSKCNVRVSLLVQVSCGGGDTCDKDGNELAVLFGGVTPISIAGLYAVPEQTEYRISNKE